MARRHGMESPAGVVADDFGSHDLEADGEASGKAASGGLYLPSGSRMPYGRTSGNLSAAGVYIFSLLSQDEAISRGRLTDIVPAQTAYVPAVERGFASVVSPPKGLYGSRRPGDGYIRVRFIDRGDRSVCVESIRSDDERGRRFERTASDGEPSVSSGD